MTNHRNYTAADLIRLKEFSFLLLLAGGRLLITGLLYKRKPPAKMTPCGPGTFKRQDAVKKLGKEAIRFAATPIIPAGILRTVAGLSPAFFTGLWHLRIGNDTGYYNGSCVNKQDQYRH